MRLPPHFGDQMHFIRARVCTLINIILHNEVQSPKILKVEVESTTLSSHDSSANVRFARSSCGAQLSLLIAFNGTWPSHCASSAFLTARGAQRRCLFVLDSFFSIGHASFCRLGISFMPSLLHRLARMLQTLAALSAMSGSADAWILTR